MRGTEQKICRQCGQSKPFDAFDFQPLLRGGYRNQCKQCSNINRKARRRANPAKTRAQQKREQGTERYRKRHCEYEKARRLADIDAFRAYRRDHYARKLKSKRVLLTPEQRITNARATLRRHWQNNREQYRAKTRAYLSRKHGANGSHDVADVLAILSAQHFSCFWCSIDITARYEIDHYIPISRGGSNGAENIVAACRRCNRSKGNKLPSEFMAYLALDRQRPNSHSLKQYRSDSASID